MASPSRMVSARHLGALLDAAADKGLVGCVDLFIENLQRGVPARYGGIDSAAFKRPRRVDNFENIGQIEKRPYGQAQAGRMRAPTRRKHRGSETVGPGKRVPSNVV
jgi:hypothetical protein